MLLGNLFNIQFRMIQNISFLGRGGQTIDYAQLSCAQWLSSDSHFILTLVPFDIIQAFIPRPILGGGMVKRKQTVWKQRTLGFQWYEKCLNGSNQNDRGQPEGVQGGQRFISFIHSFIHQILIDRLLCTRHIVVQAPEPHSSFYKLKIDVS